MSRSWYSLPAGLPRCDIPPPLSVGPSILTCTSHTPGSTAPQNLHAHQPHQHLSEILFVSRRSCNYSRSLPPATLRPSPLRLHPSPPSCTATVLPDIPDPAAHTPLPLAALPTSPPPSPHSAPRTTLPAPLPLLPPLADIPPTPTLASLTPHNSLALPHTPPPPLPNSPLPPLRIAQPHSRLLSPSSSFLSTPSESPSAPSHSAAATP